MIESRNRLLLTMLVVAVLSCASSAHAQDAEASPIAPSAIQEMEWRCIGPHMGVRGCGVAMHPTNRNVFYHAHSSGGVWMTEDAGQYWIPLTDGQINVGSIGAIAVAAANPKILYIGTGEPQLRDCVSVRTIAENANNEIIAALAAAKRAGADSKIAKRATEFMNKLVPVGKNLSQIANEPAKLLSKLTTVHWMLFHSEGRPTESAYAVVDELEKEIAAEIAAWREFKTQKGL